MSGEQVEALFIFAWLLFIVIIILVVRLVKKETKRYEKRQEARDKNAGNTNTPLFLQESIKLWIEAVKVLEVNPQAKITCPECKTGTLNVKDEPFGEYKIDRYLICDSCGRYNVLTMAKPT